MARASSLEGRRSPAGMVTVVRHPPHHSVQLRGVEAATQGLASEHVQPTGVGERVVGTRGGGLVVDAR